MLRACDVVWDASATASCVQKASRKTPRLSRDNRGALSRQSEGIFSRSGCSPNHGLAARALARDDQALAGHDDPAAILPADGVDAAEPRHRIAGKHFIHA